MHQPAAIVLREVVLDTPDLRRLYEEHALAVRKMAQRLLGPQGEADDLVHDVFLVAWRKRSILNRMTAVSFLFGTTVKLAAGMRRRAKLRQFLGLSAAEDVPDWRTPERAAEQRDSQRIVYQILEHLPEQRRTVFILHELHGMTCNEVADLIGCPVDTVWSRYYKARREFIAALDAFELQAGPSGREGTR